MEGGAWQATVKGVAKSRTRLSYFIFPKYIENDEHAKSCTWVFIGDLSIASKTQRQLRGFLGSVSSKESPCQFRRHRRCRFDPWIRMIPWRIKRKLALVFLPGKLQGQRSLVGLVHGVITKGLSTEAINMSLNKLMDVKTMTHPVM